MGTSDAVTEFMRFSLDEVNAGLASGWTFASGWFRYQSSWWAWYSRPVREGDM